MSTNVLPKPEDILWPVTERTVEAINFNFDLLFRDVAGVSTDIIPVARGGTNLTSDPRGDLLYASSAAVIGRLADVAVGSVLLSGGVGEAPAYGPVDLTVHVTGILPASNGGTGHATYAVGDLLYASAVDTLSRLASVATGNVLLAGGLATAPTWGKVGLATHVDGTLPIANGGTGETTAAAAFAALAPTTTKGDLIVDDGSAPARLGVGTDGYVLTADAASALGVKWAEAAAGFTSPLTTKGDVFVYGAADARLPVGTDGHVLTADSAEILGVKWAEAAGGGEDHDLLSSTHLDTDPDDPVAGDLIVAEVVTSATSNKDFWGDGGAESTLALLGSDEAGQGKWIDGAPSSSSFGVTTGAKWTRLPLGSPGQVLTATSAGAQWATQDAATLRARVYRSAWYTLATATEYAVAFDLEESDPDNLHDNSVNNTRLTIPANGAGLYLVVGQGSYLAQNGGRRAAWIYRNGSRVAISEGYTDTAPGAAIGFTLQVAALLDLNPGDYVELYVRQDSGSDDEVLGGSADLTTLQAVMLKKA